MQVHVNIQDLIYGDSEVLADAFMTEADKRNFIMAISERMEDLVFKYCPFDKGNLRKSLEIKETQSGVIYSYSAPYAPYVHEILYRHHAKPTRAKWLTEALKQALKELILEFGNENIPGFQVILSTSPTLQLELTTDNRGLNWREFV